MGGAPLRNISCKLTADDKTRQKKHNNNINSQHLMFLTQWGGSALWFEETRHMVLDCGW